METVDDLTWMDLETGWSVVLGGIYIRFTDGFTFDRRVWEQPWERENRNVYGWWELLEFAWLVRTSRKEIRLDKPEFRGILSM